MELERYHAGKTGALFEASAAMGALSVGGEPEDWKRFGRLFGKAYQVVDDLRDRHGDGGALGKPVGRDAALGRPNAVRQLGLPGALALLRRTVEEAEQAIPVVTDPRAARDLLRAVFAPALGALRHGREEVSP